MGRPKHRSPFGRVFQRTGRPGWYVRVRIGDSEFVRWAGPDARTATDYLAKLRLGHARRDLLGERPTSAIAFSGFKDRLLAYMKAEHEASTLEAEEPRVERIFRHFGERPLRSVTTSDVREFLTGLLAERRRGKRKKAKPASAGTKNRYLSVLSLLFRLAVEAGYAERNPCDGIERAREHRPPVPFQTDADVAALVARADTPRDGALVRLLADTGLRRSEACRLVAADVHLVRKVVVVRRSKGKVAREVPLTEAAVEALKPVCRGKRPGHHLWPEYATEKGMDALTARFRALAKRAGIPISLHGLRHGFCSRLAQLNVPLPTIMALAGHASLATTQRYAVHLPGGATVDAIALLEGRGTQGGTEKGKHPAGADATHGTKAG